MVGVTVGDQDDVDVCERVRLRLGAMTLQWSEALAQEGIRQDPEAADLEQDRRVTHELNIDRRSSDRDRITR
jgi:hypothetical protein